MDFDLFFRTPIQSFIVCSNIWLYEKLVVPPFLTKKIGNKKYFYVLWTVRSKERSFLGIIKVKVELFITKRKISRLPCIVQHLFQILLLLYWAVVGSILTFILLLSVYLLWNSRKIFILLSWWLLNAEAILIYCLVLFFIHNTEKDKADYDQLFLNRVTDLATIKVINSI